jgi:signal transduction histidine kinase
VALLRLLLALLPIGALPAAAAAPPVETLTRASILLDSRETPPPDEDPAWQVVTLPDEWRKRRREKSGFAWYRLEVAGPAPPAERLALYLPSVGMNAAAWVNRIPVGSGGGFEEPVARNFNRPLYFPFSSALLDRQHNVIHVRLYSPATPLHGFLGPVEVGPAERLRPRFEHRLFLQAGLAELATWLTLSLLAVIGAIWLGTRFDGRYGWFALASSFWVANSLNYWVRDVPVSSWAWERLVNAPLEGFAVALALWVHRLLGLEKRAVERVLLGAGAAAIVTIWLLPRDWFFPVVIWLHAGALAVGGYAVATVAANLRRFPPWQAGVYLAGGAVCFSFAAHDLAIQLGRVPATSPQLLPFMVPVLLAAFGATLTARFVASLHAAESLASELERRVASKTLELERSHERARELERVQILARERERIMREMHDGLGGQLVSALSLAESDDARGDVIAAALRNALEEMRAIVDSLDPNVEDLGQLLGQLRARLAPVLRRSGVRLVWDVGRAPEFPRLGPEASLHVLRILQEAITNVVKHASAGEVRVSVRMRTGRVAGASIEIRDDGRGGAAAQPGGRGLRNMRERARRLGATLRVEDATPGTRVELVVPLTPRRP